MSDLEDSLCGNSDKTAPARHASKPMEPAKNIDMDMDMDRMMYHNTRAYSPSMHTESDMPAPPPEREDVPVPSGREAMPKVIYVTETRTECSCKSTAAPDRMHHISQIPVNVPTSSSMGAMLAASSPAMSNGVMVGASSSSVLFGSQMSAATPTPSGASPNRFHTFKGAAPAVNAAQGGVAALGVAAVMGLMIAL